MNEFLQTFLIAIIPSVITGGLSYLAAFKNANTQIRSIREQNKADIDKLVEQNKIDIESLKEKHKLEMELKEKEHNYQIELIKIQHDNDIKKDEENIKNQATANMLGGVLGSMFSQGSPVSDKLNEMIGASLQEAMTKRDDNKS